MTVQISGFPAKLSGVETVKAKQYYVNKNGDVVFLDSFIKPCLLFDGRERKSFFFSFLK